MLIIKNLKKGFNKGTEFENNIFTDFNLTIENNTSTAIIGSNGCGKSTLLAWSFVQLWNILLEH